MKTLTIAQVQAMAPDELKREAMRLKSNLTRPAKSEVLRQIRQRITELEKLSAAGEPEMRLQCRNTRIVVPGHPQLLPGRAAD